MSLSRFELLLEEVRELEKVWLSPEGPTQRHIDRLDLVRREMLDLLNDAAPQEVSLVQEALAGAN